MSLVKSLASPWASTLVSMVPSHIRTEPGIHYYVYICKVYGHVLIYSLTCAAASGNGKVMVVRHKPIDSILFNISGKILMVQQDLPNLFASEEEVCVCMYYNNMCVHVNLKYPFL